MNYFIYYRGQIGLIVKPAFVQGVTVKFLLDDPERYFTAGGLFYDLSGTGPNPFDILAQRIPLIEGGYVSSSSRSIHLTAEGALMQLDVVINRDVLTPVLEIHSLPQGANVSYVVGDNTNTQDLLSAILMATTQGLTSPKIQKAKFNRLMGEMSVLNSTVVHWYRVPDVLVKLRAIAPKVEV